MSTEQVQGATIGATAEAAGKTLSTANAAGESLTFGQKAVGLTFNPSGDPLVAKLKQLYAEIIDICHTERWNADALGSPTQSKERVRLFSIAITEAQGAQMWAVKGATWVAKDE
jgi:hypothetical protein